MNKKVCCQGRKSGMNAALAGYVQLISKDTVGQTKD